MRLLTDPDRWDGTLPAVLLGEAPGVESRRGLLRILAARVLRRAPGEVEIVNEEGRAPRLLRPASAGLRLSSASRDGMAAAAIGSGPIGIDIERVDGSAELPWGVLHPAEAAALRALPDPGRPAAFARLWTCKEAYLKALGAGLAREPSSVRVAFVDGERAVVCELTSGRDISIQSVWTRSGEEVFCVSLCCMNPAE